MAHRICSNPLMNVPGDIPGTAKLLMKKFGTAAFGWAHDAMELEPKKRAFWRGVYDHIIRSLRSGSGPTGRLQMNPRRRAKRSKRAARKRR